MFAATRRLSLLPAGLVGIAVLLGPVALTGQEDGRRSDAPDHPADLDDAGYAIQRVVLDGEHPLLRWPRFPHYRDELEGIYGTREWGTLWLRDGRPLPAAREAVEVLADAWLRGLDTLAYDVPWLRERLRDIETAAPLTGAELGLFDVGLTVAVLRHVSDLHTGRVNPRNVHFGFNIEAKRYALATLVPAAVEGGRVRAMVEEAEPHLDQYMALRQALVRYRRLAAILDTVPAPTADTTVHVGDYWGDAVLLARRLRAFGDLRPGEEAAGRGPVYDTLLARGVRRFQDRHGLGVDGVVGRETLAALAVPMARRVEQLELSLERLRWLPEPTGARFLLVNIPAFELWGYGGHPDEGPSLQMRVVVGRALNTQTPAFQEDMRYLVFRPYWDVPYGITVREIIPALRRDPSYLARQQMEAVPRGGGAPIREVSDELIRRIAGGELRVRQRPGPWNSLGPVKFIFPNADNIYLHGTPATELFARSRRDFSHGCIRVEDPVELAHWVLDDPVVWPEARVREAMGGTTPRRVDLADPLPVLVFYTTAVVRPDGRVAFYADIYHHDRHLSELLATGYPYEP